MKIRNLIIVLTLVIFSGCASIPKEVVTLSQTLGKDIKVLHNSHINTVEVYFGKIKYDINSFIDEKYAPFIIHYVLKSELVNYKQGKTSLFGTIEIAGQKEGQKEANDALNVMVDFQETARKQIESKREELLSPILKQESEITSAVNKSYENVQYANSSITAYLQSIRKVKEAQQQALSMVGLEGSDSLVTNSLVKLSEQVEKAVKTGKEIDIQSDDAYKQLERVANQMKEITTKK
jgi:hypothetical protein